MRPWLRVLSTLSYMLAFAFISLPIHEFFHFLVLRLLGGDGFITYGIPISYTHFTQPPSHEWVVDLAGGVLTGVFFLTAFWFWAWKSKTVNDTNLEVATFACAAGHLGYAPTELIFDPVWGPLAFGVTMMLAALAYVSKLSAWLAPRRNAP